MMRYYIIVIGILQDWSVQIIQKNQSIEMKPLENLIQKTNKRKKKELFIIYQKLYQISSRLLNQFNEFLKMLNNKKINLLT